MTYIKPKCRCGMDMVVIEYDGYYDRFRFWGFDRDCTCTKGVRVRHLTPDVYDVGSYASLSSEQRQRRDLIEARPACGCGVSMEVVGFVGYYDVFNYWRFGKGCTCTTDEVLYGGDVDDRIKGGYN